MCASFSSRAASSVSRVYSYHHHTPVHHTTVPLLLAVAQSFLFLSLPSTNNAFVAAVLNQTSFTRLTVRETLAATLEHSFQQPPPTPCRRPMLEIK